MSRLPSFITSHNVKFLETGHVQFVSPKSGDTEYTIEKDAVGKLRLIDHAVGDFKLISRAMYYNILNEVATAM